MYNIIALANHFSPQVYYKLGRSEVLRGFYTQFQDRSEQIGVQGKHKGTWSNISLFLQKVKGKGTGIVLTNRGTWLNISLFLQR